MAGGKTEQTAAELLRASVSAAQIERELPRLGNDERRRVFEERLRAQADVEAEDQVRCREQAHAEARHTEARAADQERAERERAAADADAVRQAPACEDCGQQQAGGLCEACSYRRRTEALIVEAAMVAATWAADLDDQAGGRCRTSAVARWGGWPGLRSRGCWPTSTRRSSRTSQQSPARLAGTTTLREVARHVNVDGCGQYGAAFVRAKTYMPRRDRSRAGAPGQSWSA
ncbi:hypothetical protein [Streptomyces sp. NPDC059814]|uniref:hypothetical protein n=1 Tax=Streptomyces sp. NPDC059814 TaxID=3346959 RepID=UPI00365112E2